MEHHIAHACGHEQVHHLTGFPSQQERKARWLAKTSCRSCFVATKRAEEAATAARASAAVAHLALPPLLGSERQVGWASSIRASRIAAITGSGDEDVQPCLLVDDAKWWIDTRALADPDLLAKAQHFRCTASASQSAR